MVAAEEAAGHSASEKASREFVADASASIRGGAYADMALVSHDPDTFTIDFFSTDPTVAGQAVLQARVRLSHRMALRLHLALADNLRQWAPKELAARELEVPELRGLARDGGEQDGDD